MRLVFMLFAVALSTIVCAQAPTPKLRINPGFFSESYELGEKTVKYKEVQLHLDKTEQEAAYLWRRAKSNSNAAGLWSVIGSVGMLVAVFSEQPAVSLSGACVGVVGYSASLGYVLSEGSKKKKARYLYNHKYGYE